MLVVVVCVSYCCLNVVSRCMCSYIHSLLPSVSSHSMIWCGSVGQMPSRLLTDHSDVTGTHNEPPLVIVQSISPSNRCLADDQASE